MLATIRNRTGLQYLFSLLIGFCFGFLLQRGRVCDYEVILGQLLLEDFTVVKIILTAIVTGMIGVYALRSAGLVSLHKKAGSLGTSIPGPLIFGVGFAILGYCPGTSVGAVGHGALDALVGGVGGIMIGSALYAAVYPFLKERILDIGPFGDKTLVDLLRPGRPWIVVLPAAIIMISVLFVLEQF